MKVSILSALTLSLMLFGASVSWTKKAIPQKSSHAAKKKKKKKQSKKRKKMAATTQSTSANKHIRALLKREIKKGIALLKKKNYVSFLKRFIAPSDTKKILGHRGIKIIAPQFGRYKAAMLLAVFDWIKNKKPILSKDQKRAVYSLKGFRSSTPKQQISFVQEKGIWYVKD